MHFGSIAFIRKRIMAALGAAALAVPMTAAAIDIDRPEVREFIAELAAAHDIEAAEIERVLSQAEVQTSIIEAMERPAERTKPWHEYRDIFITEKRIDAGLAFWREHRDTIARISADTGVPPEILLGIIGVESYYGRITGRYRVIDALATLTFEYPPRAKFFRRELAEFIVLAREEKVDPLTALGSYAGAMGSPQFIPTSYRAYAVDSNGDGRRDLWNSWEDVIGSVANYFVVHKWRPGEEVTSRATLAERFAGAVPEKNSLKADASVAALSNDGVVFATGLPGEASARLIAFEGAAGPEYWVGFHNFYVITRYNRSAMYAMAVWQLGSEIVAAAEAATVAEQRP
jgi:membrane-bound lytic murein transglycosylase B